MTNANENRIYVGNLPFNISEEDFKAKFATFGPVDEVVLVRDRITGRSKGFGFVTYKSADSAKTAIDQMHGKDLGGRNITVNLARPREEGAGGGRSQRPRRFNNNRNDSRFSEFE